MVIVLSPAVPENPALARTIVHHFSPDSDPAPQRRDKGDVAEG
jgi:hypothetical protein